MLFCWNVGYILIYWIYCNVYGSLKPLYFFIKHLLYVILLKCIIWYILIILNNHIYISYALYDIYMIYLRHRFDDWVSLSGVAEELGCRALERGRMMIFFYLRNNNLLALFEFRSGDPYMTVNRNFVRFAYSNKHVWISWWQISDGTAMCAFKHIFYVQAFFWC